MNLQRIVRGKISVFVNQSQLYPYYEMGAAGCWSTEVWMGPWPILYLLEQVRKGDTQKAMEVIEDLSGVGAGKPVPGSGNKRPQEFADYCKVGPTRVPFVTFPEAKLAEAKGRAAHWKNSTKNIVRSSKPPGLVPRRDSLPQIDFDVCIPKPSV